MSSRPNGAGGFAALQMDEDSDEDDFSRQHDSIVSDNHNDPLFAQDESPIYAHKLHRADYLSDDDNDGGGGGGGDGDDRNIFAASSSSPGPTQQDLERDYEQELGLSSGFQLDDIDDDILYMTDENDSDDFDAELDLELPGLRPLSLHNGSRARFQPGSCRNILSMLVFFVFFAGVSIFLFLDLEEHPADGIATRIIVAMSFFSAICGGLLLLLWVYINQNSMWFSQFFSICCVYFFAFSHYAYEDGIWQVGLLAFIIASAMALWFWSSARSGKFQFAYVMLGMISKLVQSNPLLITISCGVLLVQAVWVSVFSLAAIQATKFNHFGSLYIVLGFAFYWTTQVFKHVVHVVTSGTVAFWYFADRPNAVRISFTVKCLSRALSTFFGSICYGSLFTAIARLFWTLFRRAM
jgi:Plasma-membrane choline transporter